jgi:hypothetical protein
MYKRNQEVMADLEVLKKVLSLVETRKIKSNLLYSMKWIMGLAVSQMLDRLN